MLKRAFFIILFFSISILLNSAESRESLKTVAILFSASSEIEDDLFDILSEQFTIQITSTNRNYMIITRDYLNKILDNLKFKRRDTFNDDAAQQIGKLAEAELVISCSVVVSKNDYNVSIRGIDVLSGQILFSENRQTRNKKDLDEIIEQVVSVSKSDLEKESAEKERLEKERLAKEKEEKERLEKDRLAKEKAEKERLEKDRLAKELAEKERLLKEAEEKAKIEENDKSNESIEKTTEKSKFTKNEEIFINKFYKKSWGFSLDDREKSLLKYKQSMGAGIGLAATGGTIFLGGLVSMVVIFVYYENIDNPLDVYDNSGNLLNNYRNVKTQKIKYEKMAPILGATLMPAGVVIVSLSAIPFLFSYMIATIYKKETGEKLTFFDRVNFNIGFVMSNNTYGNEKRLNISMGIKM